MINKIQAVPIFSAILFLFLLSSNYSIQSKENINFNSSSNNEQFEILELIFYPRTQKDSIKYSITLENEKITTYDSREKNESSRDLTAEEIDKLNELIIKPNYGSADFLSARFETWACDLKVDGELYYRNIKLGHEESLGRMQKAVNYLIEISPSKIDLYRL